MSTAHPYLVVFVALYCIRAFAADGNFYRLFQSAATNERSMEIYSPHLVDTNNTGFKLTNALLHLDALKADGEPSGIRLGMSMEEVVAQWGKPIGIDPQCLGYPHFIYREAHVYFDKASNSVKAIHGDVPDLARTLGTWPTTEDCIRQIGTPSQRQYHAEGTHYYLVYENPKGRMRLLCISGKLTGIEWGPDLRK